MDNTTTITTDKIMKKFLKIACGSAAILLFQQAHAQISYFKGSVSDGTIGFPNFASLGITGGAIPAVDTPVTFYGSGTSFWTSFSNGSTVSANTAVTANTSGDTSGDTISVSTPGFNLLNASAWTTITGDGFHYRELDVRFTPNDSVTVTILGPTLNNYGLTGARNFSWTASARTDNPYVTYSWSGTGEGSFTISATVAAQIAASRRGGYVFVSVVPTYYYENGAVLVEATH